MTNYLIDKIKMLKSNRKKIRQQERQTKDTALKSNLNKQIDDNLLSQKKAELDRLEQIKREKQEQIKEDIKERFYYLTNKTYNTFKKIGLLESKRELSELLNKHPTYLTAIEFNRKMPKIDTMETLKSYITEVLDSIDLLITDKDMINRDNLTKILKGLYESFDELKKDMIIKLYKIWG